MKPVSEYNHVMSEKRRITISHIARKANVSKSTVSRVLNNSTPVTEDKRQAVLQAIAALDYRPNVFAQGLASGQSLTIGVLTQGISSPFYDAILRGILEGLDDSRYQPFIADGFWNTRRQREVLEAFQNRSVDGLIVLGGDLPAAELRDIAKQIPLVVVGRYLGEALSNCSLQLDDYAGAYQATSYLIQQGHTQIAHMTGILTHEDAQQRRAGYCQALRDAGLTIDDHLIVEGDFTQRSGLLLTEVLFARGQLFSAIFAANDQMAQGAHLALFRRGIRVPDDVSLIGFDDQPASAYMTPPLTTVQQPAREIGRAAAEMLLGFMRQEPVTIPHFPAKLILRESVARHR